MNAEKETIRPAVKRLATDSFADREPRSCQETPRIGDLADDYEFLAPNELCSCALGLLYSLTTKRLMGVSFSTLYRRSRKHGWLSLLQRERKNLKSNVNSIEKCFMLNRLMVSCEKNPTKFDEQTAQLYEYIEKQMSVKTTASVTVEDWHNEVLAWQNIQCRRRLFHFGPHEMQQSLTLLDLQYQASQFCSQWIKSCASNSQHLPADTFHHLKRLLKQAFVIVAQPSIPECVAGTKYEKNGPDYTARLNSRIICLLDPAHISAHFTLSDVHVTLVAMDGSKDDDDEEQKAIAWGRRALIDASGASRTLLYAELHSIRLRKSDLRNSRPLHSGKLCQLRFRIKVQIHPLDTEENLVLLSRPFGLCSHAQYFPEYIAKVIHYEFEQISRNIHPIHLLPTLADGICRYHTRISGVPVMLPTREFILKELQNFFENKKNDTNITTSRLFETIIAKMVSQIEFFLDHPFLAMMYEDGLFLGLCDSSIDESLKGTGKQPQLLLRFNTLAGHLPTQQASIRYIVHHGRLTKSTFHGKAFIDEMCRVIYASNEETSVKPCILSYKPDITFQDFHLYFDEELIRLSAIAPTAKEAYKPLIPVLWSTMKHNADDLQSSSPLSHTDSGQSSTSASKQEQSSAVGGTFSTSDTLLQLITGQLSEMLTGLQHETYPSADASTAGTSAQQQRQDNVQVVRLLHDFLQSRMHVKASAQIIDTADEKKSYKAYCFPASNL